jgi:GTP cyclohydrolase II
MTWPAHETTELRTIYGAFEFHCFAWGPHEEENILCQVKRPFTDRVLVRVQSACYTAEIFRSTDCDCHEQLDASLKRIAAEGGILIYMLCDGRGAGLLNKVRGLALGTHEGLDTHDAYLRLGIPLDNRNYERAAYVLGALGAKRVALLTNNPRKLAGLAERGFDVSREPLEIAATASSMPYLKTKAAKMGHLMKQFATSRSED